MSPWHLNLTRTYAAKFEATHYEIRPDKLYSKRVAVLVEAMDQLRTDYVAAKFDLDHEGKLILEISATNAVLAVNHVTARILEAAIKDADKAFQQVTKAIKNSWSYFDVVTGLHITAITLNFNVNRQIVAATRDQKRLTGYAAQSVIDFRGRFYGDPPRPDQYTITQSGESSLQISSSEDKVAEDVTLALLDQSRGPRPSRRSIDNWPPPTTPYWSIGTLALAIFTLVIAPFKVTPGFLILTAVVTVSITLIALITARIFGASVPKTVLGMTPSIIVFGFAVYYGAVMIGSQPAVKVAATGTPHLVDTFLLSVGMASTGGFFDLALGTTAVRVAAFAEMLSMVTVAGGSLYIGAQAAYDKLADVMRPGAPRDNRAPKSRSPPPFIAVQLAAHSEAPALRHQMRSA